MGKTLSLEVTGKAEVDINLNEVWLAQQLASAAVSLGAVPVALIVGGIMSVCVRFFQIAPAQEGEHRGGRR